MQLNEIKTVFTFAVAYLFFYILIFLPAGTLDWFDAWVFIIVLTIFLILTGIYLLLKKPEALRSRASIRPKTTMDKIMIVEGPVCFLLLLMVPGYDVFQLKISNVQSLIKILALLTFIECSSIFFLVIREKPYVSRIVEVQQGQKVIDTGPYKYIRHPMYAALLLAYNCIPLMLGSYLGLIFSLLVSINLFIRISDEEKYLEKDLPGYTAYKHKVRYRLIPKLY